MPAGRTHGPWPSRATDSVANDAIGRGPGGSVPDPGGLATHPGAGPAGRPVAAADPGRHRLPGRGPVPVGRAPGVGQPAARRIVAAVPLLLLRRPVDLPAAGRAGP